MSRPSLSKTQTRRHIEPSSAGATEPILRWSSSILAWAILLFGVFTAVITAWIVHANHSPVLCWDQWAIVNDLMRSNGHPTLGQLWAQHNEHRIPFGRLASYADLIFFGGRNTSLFIEIYVIQGLEALLLIWMFRRYSGLRSSEVLTAAGFFIFCSFYPIQIENFYWGFQVSFVLLPLCSTLAIAAAVVHSERISQTPDRWFSGALALSLTAALGAELSLASGLFIWPVLLLTGYILRVPRKTQYLTAAVALPAFALFLWGYHTPGQHAKPLDSLLHPFAVYLYIRTYFAESWNASVPTASLFPSLAESTATLAMVGVVLGFVALLRRPLRVSKLNVFLVMNAVFILITSILTALGRINFGTAQAASSRYQTMALVFWGCISALVLVWRGKEPRRVLRVAEVQIIILFLMVAGGGRFNSARVAAAYQQKRLAKAYAELFQDPSSMEARRELSPYSNLPEAFQYLRSHHMGPDLYEVSRRSNSK